MVLHTGNAEKLGTKVLVLLAMVALVLLPLLTSKAALAQGPAATKNKDAKPDLPAEDQDLPDNDEAKPVRPPETEGTMRAPGAPAVPGGAGGAILPAAAGPVPAGAAAANPSPAAPVKVVVPPAPTAGKGAAAVPAGQELVNIDFPEPTEIKDIIKAVALWTGKNVILDRNVNGKVQIISPRKVTKEEAYQAFLSALNLLGLTTVETGKVIKIMPVRTAVKGNLKTFLGSSWTPMTDEIITQIVPLKYIDAKDIQSTLSRIVSSNAMIAYPPTNTLIISDSGYKVRRVLDILELLDVQGQQAQVAIVAIRYAEAKSIADKVSEIFKNSAAEKKGTAGGNYRSYKIMTDERTNSVIIFGPPRTIADVKALVRKFDIPLEDPSRQSTIHVRPLDYADAKKLSATLSALATGKKTDTLHRPPVSIPGQPPGMQTQDALSVASLSDDVKITADDSTNALVITGSHAAYQTINSLIRKLDLRRSQVYVEADILDLNMGSDFHFGTSIFGGKGGPGSTAIATTWQAGPLGALIQSQVTQTAGGTSGANTTQLGAAAQTFAEDMNIGILSGKQVTIPGLGTFSPGALIKMIKNDSNTRVLSSPNILTTHSEEATISVGQKIIFRVQDTAAAGTGATVVNKTEKEDVDLILGIKPFISQSNYVTLDINLEDNSATVDKATGLPLISKRKTKQKVTVKNSQTVVISGLVQTTEFESFQKIPLLGDIPIIGWLFRNSQIDHTKNNLMIFLTPHIIHGADDLALVYKQKREETDQFLANVFGAGHIKDDFYALLPTKEDGEYRPDDSDRQEKARRDEMLKEMYESSGMTKAVEPPPPAANKDEAKKGKVDESPTYVPLSGDEFEGGGGGSGEGGAPEPPPPPPPPPEPAEPPPEG